MVIGTTKAIMINKSLQPLLFAEKMLCPMPKTIIYFT